MASPILNDTGSKNEMDFMIAGTGIPVRALFAARTGTRLPSTVARQRG